MVVATSKTLHPKKKTCEYSQAEVVAIGVPPRHLDFWSKRRCPILDKPLSRRTGPDGEWLYLRKEIDRIWNLPRPVDEFVDKDGVVIVSNKLAAELAGVTSWGIYTWIYDCCWKSPASPLVPRRIWTYNPDAQKVACTRRYYWSKKEVAEISRRKRSSSDPEEWSGIRWDKACKILKVSRPLLGKLLWKKHECLKDGYIRTRPHHITLSDGRVSRVILYSSEDVKAVARERKAHKELIRTACQRPVPAGDLTDDEAARFLDVTSSTIRTWHKRGCRHLPNRRKLDRGADRPGCGGRGSRLTKTYSRKDLEEIRRLILETESSSDQFEFPDGLYCTPKGAADKYSRNITAAMVSRWHRDRHCSQLGREIHNKPHPIKKREVLRKKTPPRQRPPRAVFLDDDLRKIDTILGQRKQDGESLKQHLRQAPRLASDLQAEWAKERGICPGRLLRLLAEAGAKKRFKDGRVGDPYVYYLFGHDGPPAVSTTSLPPAPVQSHAANTTTAHASRSSNREPLPERPYPVLIAGYTPEALEQRNQQQPAADPGAPEPPPGWIAPWYHGRTLRLGAKVLMRFTAKRKATSQEAILEAIQQNAWRSPTAVQSLHEDQLGDGVHQLTVKLRPSSLRIERDGSGRGVIWRLES